MDTHRDLIGEIEDFCLGVGIAEPTFGRRVVNDGKFVGRLRQGKGKTTATVARVRRFLSDAAPDGLRHEAARPGEGGGAPATDGADTRTTFRFYDNR